MNIIFVDTREIHFNLLPLTYTRPACRIRSGILTIAQKWQNALGCEDISYRTVDYLKPKFPESPVNNADTLFIYSNVVPCVPLVEAVTKLRPGQRLCEKTDDGAQVVVAYRGENGAEGETIVYDGKVNRIDRVYDIFLQAADSIVTDYSFITAGRRSQPAPPSVTVIGDPDLLFIEEGAEVEGAIINTKGGPVYIGPGATVMEGSCLRGPIALCEHATVNMGTRIYGGTSIGPWCKVGGELNNVVMFSYSNKAHDGFLGNAVIGKWCNIGAGCTASNLKNDYTPIKLWHYPSHRFIPTGLQFCGVIMGDHTKCGINTMLNTATVLGVGVNIHGSGFPRPFVASFSEGSAAGFTDVSMEKFFDIARRMMARRDIPLTQDDIDMFLAIRKTAENYK